MGNKLRVMESPIEKKQDKKNESENISCLICNKKVLSKVEKHKCELRNININQELIIK